MGRNWIELLDARRRGEVPGFHSTDATTEQVDKAEAAALRKARGQNLAEEDRATVAASAHVADTGNVKPAHEATVTTTGDGGGGAPATPATAAAKKAAKR